MDKEYKGTNGILILKDTEVVIKRGKRGFFMGGGQIRGDKSIPYSSITAVQFKPCRLTAGYIQFTLQGGLEAKGGIFQAIKDENTVSFNSLKNSKLFEEAKETIEKKMHESRSGGDAGRSDADELEKYAGLRDKKMITEEEFQTKKKQILGL
jgi:hypothetical protein